MPCIHGGCDSCSYNVMRELCAVIFILFIFSLLSKGFFDFGFFFGTLRFSSKLIVGAEEH